MDSEKEMFYFYQVSLTHNTPIGYTELPAYYDWQKLHNMVCYSNSYVLFYDQQFSSGKKLPN
jgi:hypothetical protein